MTSFGATALVARLFDLWRWQPRIENWEPTEGKCMTDETAPTPSGACPSVARGGR